MNSEFVSPPPSPSGTEGRLPEQQQRGESAPRATSGALPRVLILAENASEDFGGEAVLPLRYFEGLRARGVPTWLITHARVATELQARKPELIEFISFTRDTRLQRLLWRLGTRLEHRLRYTTLDFASRLITQRTQRRLARIMVMDLQIDVVHQPTPVSPLEPSLFKNVGAPIVFGPMNGATEYPPAFRQQESLVTRCVHFLLRRAAPALNRVISGKRHAAALIVANDRSLAKLHHPADTRIFRLSENGVDLNLWKRRSENVRAGSACRFVFVGRLIRSKGVDHWLRAFERCVAEGTSVTGLVIGEGPESASLQAQASEAGILARAPYEIGKVYFAGWKYQTDVAELLAEQDCLVLPTLCECGGAVILEAMASELPVIATNWGGPADYITQASGILISAEDQNSFILGFVEAMQRIAFDPDLRRDMGRAGREEVERLYCWDSKIDAIVEIYREAIARSDLPVGQGDRP